MQQISKIRIHPAIGIARLGNHPTAYFIGPEKPHFITPAPAGGYKENDQGTQKIKRQAARFRLYGYDDNDQLVKEITTADGEISWTVHLANKKASWREFNQLNPNEPLRNRVNTPEHNRQQLNIDPGPRSISANHETARFTTGSFTEWNAQRIPKTLENIHLGDISRDSDGRLLVLGGHGQSGSPWHTPMTGTFNNDGWYDDIADGPVDAEVTLTSGVTVPVSGAWVLSVPPNFAPPVGNLITLYDTIYQKFRNNGQYDDFVASGQIAPINTPPSWTKDVYPLLKRIFNIPWVIDISNQHSVITEQILNPDFPLPERRNIFSFLRTPDHKKGRMPRLLGDVPRDINKSLTFTAVQYPILSQWMEGNIDENNGQLPNDNNIGIDPQGLDRAALENCVGGGFHPGIEASWFVRDVYEYAEAFRFSRQQGLSAGDITKQMAVPWQADFYGCDKQEGRNWGFSTYGFWPAVRPDDVIPQGQQGPKRRPWLQGLVNNRQDMVDNWHKLGFVVEVSQAPAIYTETERQELD